MSSAQTQPVAASANSALSSSNTPSPSSTAPPQDASSKHKKNPIGSWFVKKFGRRNSEVNSQSQPPSTSSADYSRSSSKAKEPRNRRASNFTPSNPSHTATTNGPATASRPVDALPSFVGDSGQGLASTLMVPPSSSSNNPVGTPPPQLARLPQQEPLGNLGFSQSDVDGGPSRLVTTAPAPPIKSVPAPLQVGSNLNELSSPISDVVTPRAVTTSHDLPSVTHFHDQSQRAEGNGFEAAAPILPTKDDRRTSSNSNDSSSHDGLGRDSIGNRTNDTGKSRASTKPTTLMSLDTRENPILPTTHIAQVRNGENGSAAAGTGVSGASAVQFATPASSRGGSGTRPYSGSIDESGQYVTIPSYSRPHPANNPQPFSMPTDNASVLTLASSTAAHSLAGAASSRSYGHAHAPSLGGARSIGGSLMGDRRNSSDTYASLKALPPLSRRGSDSSSRTRESVAASATGQNSAQAQAMYTSSVGAGGAGAGAGPLAGVSGYAGPGAPSDRVSIHRTPSQRTVATQRSIPLSASASNPALHAYSGSKAESTTGGAAAAVAPAESPLTVPTGSGSLGHGSGVNHAVAPGEGPRLSSTEEGTARSGKAAADPSDGLLEAHAANIAATAHDAPPATAGREGENEAVQAQEKLRIPGGPAVSP